MSQSSDLDEFQMNLLEQSSKPDSTNRATTWGLKKFIDWLSKRGKNCDFHTVSAVELNELLRKFYAELKSSKQGTSLTPSSLTGIRAALHRHFSQAPLNRPFNIIKDKEFLSANNMFTARCKLYMKSNNVKPKHKPSIETADMKKLGTYFANYHTSPDVLIEAVWFYICYFFGRRGREGWTLMSKNTFIVQKDADGVEFVSMALTETTKNHQGGNKQHEIDYSDQRMYGNGVEIFKLYMSKLHPECQRLFQTPKRSYHHKSHWFRNEPMGKNYLSNIMQRISEKAGLSVRYTCHSVRASTITNLYQAGINPQSIIAVTKHKNTQSLNHYISDISIPQKKECSSILDATLNQDELSDDEEFNNATFSIVLDNDSIMAVDEQVPETSTTSSTVENLNTNSNSTGAATVGDTPNLTPMILTASDDGTVTIPPPTNGTSVYNIDIPTSTMQTYNPQISHHNVFNFNNCNVNIYQK